MNQQNQCRPPLPPPPGYTPHCGYCGRPHAVCTCGTGQAGALPADGTTLPAVSLPNQAEKKQTPVEETQDDGLPPPSGWRDRPPLA